MQNVIDELIDICGSDSVLQNVSLKDYTSMKVGGNADVVIEPDSIVKIKDCICALRKGNVPYMIMGNGSNLIFSDEGFRG